MAIFPGAVLKLIPPDRNDPPIIPRLMIFHIAVSLADSLYPDFVSNQRPTGSKIESHFYVRFDGTIEQYRDTGYQADANTDANDFAISVETQGLEMGEWTPAQFASLQRLALWGHQKHPIPLAKAQAWNGSGFGYHILFMDRWAGGPRSCPGPQRVAQFNNKFVPWLANPVTAPVPPKEFDMSDAQYNNLIAQNNAILKQLGTLRADVDLIQWATTDAKAGLRTTLANTQYQLGKLAQSVGTGVDLTDTEVAQIAKQTADEFDARAAALKAATPPPVPPTV